MSAGGWLVLALLFAGFSFFWFIFGWAFPLFWIFSFICFVCAFVFIILAIAGQGKTR